MTAKTQLRTRSAPLGTARSRSESSSHKKVPLATKQILFNILRSNRDKLFYNEMFLSIVLFLVYIWG